MITRFLPLLLLFTLSQAHAKGDCEFFVGPSPLAETIAKFKELRLDSLLSEYTAGKIEISRRLRLTPWQPAVSARVSRSGNKILVLRKAELKTEVQRQKFEWQVAVALFELKMRGKFKDETRDLGDVSFESWRDSKMDKAEETLKDMYYLFMLLDRLDASVILPKRDISKYKPVRALLLRDSSRALVPNQEDFERLVSEGEEKFGEVLTDRHNRSFLFAYYSHHLRKMLLLSTAVMASAPALVELPSLIEASDSFSDFLLNVQIEMFYQASMGAVQIQSGVQALYDQYPWLVYLSP